MSTSSKSKAGKRTADDVEEETKKKTTDNGDESGEEEETTTKKAKKPKAEKKAKAKKEKKEPVGYQFNVNKALDKAHEGKSFASIIQLPPSALQGMGNKHDEMLAEFNITTIAGMANWKFFKMARAFVTLAATEEKGKREEGSKMNFNGAVDKKFEQKALKDIIKAPVSALQGLSKWADTTLEGLTIKELGTWKYFLWADALVELAKYENADFQS